MATDESDNINRHSSNNNIVIIVIVITTTTSSTSFSRTNSYSRPRRSATRGGSSHGNHCRRCAAVGAAAHRGHFAVAVPQIVRPPTAAALCRGRVDGDDMLALAALATLLLMRRDAPSAAAATRDAWAAQADAAASDAGRRFAGIRTVRRVRRCCCSGRQREQQQ